ncbi:MAG: putative rane protein [Mycobacterium sp.]|jgi:putative membrane protein|nr:putative rane protein [Mycobacterium sp.]
MLAGISLGSDFKRFTRGTMPRIALVTIVVLPLLYGAMYLWAFWNPFGHVDKLPVAVVNDDRGAVAQGRELDAGEQVVRGLVASKQLDLHQVSDNEAAEGVAHGAYYFSITVPEDFSDAIASAAGEHPRKAQIRFTFNDVNNYLASVIGQNTAREVLNQVNQRVGAQTVDAVLVGLTDAGQGLRQAADGAGRLSAGLTTAHDGAQQLAAGSRALADNLAVARDGAATLAAGTRQLSSSITTATDPVVSVLGRIDGLGLDPAAVGETASHLSAAARSAGDRIAALNIDYAQAAGIVDQVVGGLRTNPDPTVRELGETLAGAQSLMRARGIDPTTDDGVARLRSDAQQLETELGDPNSQLRRLMTRVLDGGLKADVVRLRDGATQLNTGAQRLSGGLVQLTDGGQRLADGSQALVSGTGQLKAGAQVLATKLSEGARQLPSWTVQQRTQVAQTLSSPVELDVVSRNRAATFGTGFAPFFLPLALFIGALIIWMLLTPLQSRPVMRGLAAVRVMLVSYWPGLLVALCQAMVMYAVVHFGVGLEPRYPVASLAFLALIAAVFLAMIQAFNAVFGEATGRVVALAFLMFQLVSAGGIYPVETTARPFQILHPYVPMTYAVNGLRELTVGGVDSRLWVAIGVLVGVLVVSLAATAWAARRDRQYTVARLKPPVEV